MRRADGCGRKKVGLFILGAVMGILLPAAVPAPFTSDAHGISWSIFDRDDEYFRKVQSSPRRLVEEYCEAEYNGVQDMRLKVAKVTAAQNDSARGPAPTEGKKAGRVINFSADPLIVVDSYQIKAVSTGAARAEATVVFRRLANCDVTRKRTYVADRNGRDTVTLSLEYDGSRWWIVDPPLPRVSKWALIEFSERIISSMTGIVKAGKASDGQKKYYEAHRNIVTFLRRL